MHAKRSIRCHVGGRAAEHLPERFPFELPYQIPQRNFERPAAPRVKIDVIEHCGVPLQMARVLPDKEMCVLLKAEHGVA